MSTRKVSTRRSSRRKFLGVSLVELIVFIVIVSTAVAGIISVIAITTQSSADPMTRKQALAIAEAVLEEVKLKPFTYCDPDDPAAATALNTAGCATPDAIGPEAGETRTSSTTPFDNVNDYQSGGAGGAGLTLSPVADVEGTAIAGLEGYSANIKVAAQALGAVPASDSLLITVTVTGPGNTIVTLHGYRTRYAPNDLP